MTIKYVVVDDAGARLHNIPANWTDFNDKTGALVKVADAERLGRFEMAARHGLYPVIKRPPGGDPAYDEFSQAIAETGFDIENHTAIITYGVVDLPIDQVRARGAHLVNTHRVKFLAEHVVPETARDAATMLALGRLASTDPAGSYPGTAQEAADAVFACIQAHNQARAAAAVCDAAFAAAKTAAQVRAAVDAYIAALPI